MNLRKAAEMALEALEEINKLSVGEKAVCLPAEIDGAMEALRQALAQPEQEPVGYAHVEDLKREHHDFWVNREQGVNEAPLYTAAPKRQWVGLTVNEARMFYEKYTYRGELIYAIDEFLKEKNGG